MLTVVTNPRTLPVDLTSPTDPDDETRHRKVTLRIAHTADGTNNTWIA